MLVGALLLSSCTFCRYPNGKTAVFTSANASEVAFSGGGIKLHIVNHDPATTVRAYGAATAQGILSAGGAAFRP